MVVYFLNKKILGFAKGAYQLILTPKIVQMVLDEPVFLTGFNVDQVSIFTCKVCMS